MPPQRKLRPIAHAHTHAHTPVQLLDALMQCGVELLLRWLWHPRWLTHVALASAARVSILPLLAVAVVMGVGRLLCA